MIKSISLLVATIAAVSACSNSTNTTTCLDVTLWDFFGDGWGGARVYVEFPDGSVRSDAPTCDVNPVHHTICADATGDFYLTAQDENVTWPEQWWEVFWTASVLECDGSTVWYTGGYNTTMVWHYDAPTDYWSLVYWDNLWPNVDTCEACGDAQQCKPKPKPKKDKKDDKKDKKEKDKKDKKKDKDDDEKNITTTDPDEYLEDLLEAPKYGPPAVDVRVTMYDEEGDGWFMSDYHGANWYISDSTRTKLFHTGTLCDGFNGQCRLCLGDGSYVFRVTGDYGNGTFESWDFCGVRGTYQEELTFHVKKGKCIPDALRTIYEVCAETASTNIVLGVTFALFGIPTEVFSNADASVLFGALSSEVQQFSTESMSLVSSVLDSRVTLDARRLSVFTHDVTLSVTFSAESAFGVDGLVRSDVESLIDTVRWEVESKINNGEFLSVLNQAATTMNVPLMNNVQGIELLKVELMDISYVGTEPLKYSSLVWNDEATSYTVFSSKVDIVGVAVFFSALAVGFIAFVGIMSKGMSGYQNLPQESQHNAVEEVMPTESERPLNREVSSKVEATI